MDGLLPKIKCSDCHAEVELTLLGEHVCSKVAGSPVEKQSSLSEFNEHGPPPKRSLSRESLFNRLGRVPPPMIDPTAANRPFLSHGAQLSPHSGGFAAISPLSPFQKPQRSQTSPVPPQSPAAVPDGLANLDSPFPPFPRPASAGGSKAKKLTTSINTNVSSHRGFASPSPSDGSCMSPSTEGRSSRPGTANRHRREASIDSKTFQRMSMASSRNGHGLPSPISPAGTSRGRSGDDIPPLPSGPITGLAASPVFTSGNSEPFYFGSNINNDNNGNGEHDFGGDISPKDKVRQLDGMEGLDFGFTARTKSPDVMDVDNKSEHLDMDYSDKRPDSPGPSVPAYRVDREFSVSNFASGLGLGDPYHSTNDSTSSSNSSPSEAPSTSSFSSRPSESSSVSEPKSAISDKHNGDHLRLLEEEPPVRPNADPYSYDLDSPTDPLFQQGRLSDPPASRRPSRTEEEYPAPPTLESAPKKYIPFRGSPSPSNLPSPPMEQQKPPQQQQEQPQQQPLQQQPQQVPPPQDEPQSQPPPSRSTTPGKRRHPCRGCGDIITGKSVSSADGRLTGRYHKACFVCHTCHSPFQTADFYVLDNHPYCAADYHRLNGTLCAECGHGIEGPCLEAEEIIDSQPDNSTKKNQKFHPGCFKCRTCHIVLNGDYFEWNGSAYCERDGRRAAGMMPPPRQPGGYPPHNYHGHPPSSPLSMHPVGPHGQPGPGPGPGYRRPPYASSPLAGPPQNGRGDPRYRPTNPSSLRPRPDQHRQHPSQHQFANNSSLAPGPGPGNGSGYPPGRKFPERRTTRLMMV
ncbi:hypothetical protein FQN49_000311 [Arthroderma sp. PD_2]|nr:hypothetical protein FQN49_000311 [Arthroderma sp. PD_2]